jgi:hypothetical protein
MKHAFWLTLGAVVACTSTAIAQTTLEEYNYLTKGYKIQIESGLDMKKGYRIEDVTQYHTKSVAAGTTRTLSFKALFKNRETKPCAFLCVLSRSDGKPNEYVCLPQYASTQQVWDLATERLNSFSGDDVQSLMLGFAALASFYGSR